MNKTEYVTIIEKALVGKVSPEELRDTVTYYRDYIDMEIRKGKTEQEVLDELGNPRLLAKTIAMAKGDKLTDGETAYEETSQKEPESKHIPFPILILIVILILMAFFGMVMSVLRVLTPILVPVAAIMLIVYLIKRWKD